jgi:hypothetical protein
LIGTDFQIHLLARFLYWIGVTIVTGYTYIYFRYQATAVAIAMLLYCLSFMHITVCYFHRIWGHVCTFLVAMMVGPELHQENIKHHLKFLTEFVNT